MKFVVAHLGCVLFSGGRNNVTQQKNWAPVFDGGNFDATEVFPDLPIILLLSLRQNF